MARKKAIVIAILGAVAVAAVGAWMVWNKPHKKAEDETGVAVAAPALYAAFAGESAAAYDGKVLSVTGVVAGVSTNQEGKTVAELRTDDPMGVVQCTFRETPALRPEATATVKGFCNGFTEMEGMGGTVVLNDCIVLP